MGENRGNGEKSKLIYYLLSLLLAMCGYLGRNLYAMVVENAMKVNDYEKRVSVLESNYTYLKEGNERIERKVDRLLRR